jgi:serine protease inhibitor
VKQPFLQAARDFFDAEVAALDFRSPAAPRTISSWAERETGGRIRTSSRASTRSTSCSS